MKILFYQSRKWKEKLNYTKASDNDTVSAATTVWDLTTEATKSLVYITYLKIESIGINEFKCKIAILTLGLCYFSIGK